MANGSSVWWLISQHGAFGLAKKNSVTLIGLRYCLPAGCSIGIQVNF